MKTQDNIKLPDIPEEVPENLKMWAEGILETFRDLTTEFDYYDTGWINRSDWTNVHLGSTTTKDTDSDVTHNLNTNLSDLLVKVLISTDGTDGNSFLVYDGTSYEVGVSLYGATVFQVDTDSIKVQTGADGILYVLDAGGGAGLLDTEDWYYKIKVYKLI